MAAPRVAHVPFASQRTAVAAIARKQHPTYATSIARQVTAPNRGAGFTNASVARKPGATRPAVATRAKPASVWNRFGGGAKTKAAAPHAATGIARKSTAPKRAAYAAPHTKAARAAGAAPKTHAAVAAPVVHHAYVAPVVHHAYVAPVVHHAYVAPVVHHAYVAPVVHHAYAPVVHAAPRAAAPAPHAAAPQVQHAAPAAPAHAAPGPPHEHR
jgi:hypothetical protein